MKQGTSREFSRILDALGVSCSEEIVREAMRRSSIENVRNIENSSKGPQVPEARFARDGSTRQWCDYFSAADLTHYDRLVEEYDLDLYISRGDPDRGQQQT